MTDIPREIRLEVEVPGTPEEVWAAVATGPGITAWYVPTEIEERAGGALTSSFGEGEEMTVHGRVAEWEPPRRVKFTGSEAGGLAFEWFVEARDGGTCLVRLVNSGFGDGGPWDAQYDAMEEGWRLFMRQLRISRELFPGLPGASALPMGVWGPASEDPLAALCAALDVGMPLAPGQFVRLAGPGGSGTVLEVTPGHNVLLRLDAHVAGTLSLVAESRDGMTLVSTWAYFYGEGAEEAADDARTAWGEWIGRSAAARP